MTGHIHGIIMYIEDRTQAAIAALKKTGLIDEPGTFGKRVFACVARLLKEFFSQTHTPFSSEFALGLFDRLARGEPLTAEFMEEQKKRLEALDADFSEDVEADAWLSDRYGLTPRQAGVAVKVTRVPRPKSKSQAKRLAIQAQEQAKRWMEGYGFVPDRWKQPQIFMDNYGSALQLDPDDEVENEGAEAPETKEEKKDMCLPDTDLVRTVRGVVEDFCDNLDLFTGIDVSNAVKRSGKVVRHREIAPIVREMYQDGEMDKFGYTRELIKVSLPGGRQADAWLYHHQTSDPTEYDTRAQVALPPQQTAPKTKAPPQPLPVTTTQPPGIATSAPLPQPASGHVAPRRSRMLNTASQQRVQKFDGRLEIPRGWIRQLGWAEGDEIRAVRDGDAIILKPLGSVTAGEDVLYKFKVDRWNRIRVTNRALNKVNRNFGRGGQHVVTLQTDSIKVG